MRGNDEEAARCLARWQALCGDRFYLEVQRTGRSGEQAYSEAVLDLARERGVAAVATNDVRFLTRAEFEAHEARVCIHDGALLADPSRPRRYSEEQYLKTPAEMAELFADAPELLVNTRRDRQALFARNQIGLLHAAGLPGAAGQHHRRAFCARRRSADWPSGSRRRSQLRGVAARPGGLCRRASISSSASSAAWDSPDIS